MVACKSISKCIILYYTCVKRFVRVDGTWQCRRVHTRKRTLEDLKTNSSKTQTHSRKRSLHVPLLDIEPRDIVLDELHLLLRVGDILIRNLIHLADQIEQGERKLTGGDIGAVNVLQQLICRSVLVGVGVECPLQYTK